MEDNNEKVTYFNIFTVKNETAPTPQPKIRKITKIFHKKKYLIKYIKSNHEKYNLLQLPLTKKCQILNIKVNHNSFKMFGDACIILL